MLEDKGQFGGACSMVSAVGYGFGAKLTSIGTEILTAGRLSGIRQEAKPGRKVLTNLTSGGMNVFL
jgi:hypothetical protein